MDKLFAISPSSLSFWKTCSHKYAVGYPSGLGDYLSHHHTCTRRTLIKWQKNVSLPSSFVAIHTSIWSTQKITQNTLIELETDFSGVTVIHPLPFCIFCILPLCTDFSIQMQKQESHSRQAPYLRSFCFVQNSATADYSE